ncbi:ATP-binding cassette domain-containing protein [Kamptonema cortianum]|nr:ATP-binding cassette domain-containing protein [Geitlerinema splendidum]MDK3158353.1 ATP-binding cassette domain-containing protein [Kamptonema cortianum]
MLEVRDVSVTFGEVQALHHVSLTFVPGQVHALLGENGAGKSTLMGVLAGFVVPDSGHVRLNDKQIPIGQPSKVREFGIQMVHQHFMLVPNFSVSENLGLAAMESVSGGLNLERLAHPAKAVARDLQWEIEDSARTASLSVGVRQRIEIIKALSREAKVLILDEPTAVLTPEEASELLTVLRQHAANGNIVIFIAHKLSEVAEVADVISVLRNGLLQGTGKAAELDREKIVHWMLGSLQEESPAQPESIGEAVLNVSGLRVLGDQKQSAVNGIDLQLRAGEIYAIGGVDGNGQHELAEALAGVRPIAGGAIEASGSIGYLPQDRQRDGLALDLSVEENLLLGEIPKQFKFGPFLRRSALKTHAESLIQKFEIKTPDADQPARFLSGGNQQKIVVARVMSQKPDIIIAFNPTRGLDIRATQYVHEVLKGAAHSGAAILLISTDMQEIEVLAGRTQFMSRGRLYDSFAEATD